MKLTEKAIEAIKECNKCKVKLAYELDKSETTIWRMLNENKPNGTLTTVTALGIIEDETGIKKKELLTKQ